MRPRPSTILRQIVAARIVDDGPRHVVAGQHGGGRAQIFAPASASPGCARAAPAAGAAAPASRRRPHASRRIQLAGQPRGAAHHVLARPGAGRRRPAARRRSSRPRRSTSRRGRRCTSSSMRSAVRRSASSRSAIRLPLRKKFCDGALGLLRLVDLAGLEPRQQFVGRHVDQHHFVGLVEHGVGHGFARRGCR